MIVVLHNRARFDPNEWFEALGKIGVGGLVVAHRIVCKPDELVTVSQSIWVAELCHLDPDMYYAENSAGEELLFAARAAKRLSLAEEPTHAQRIAADYIKASVNGVELVEFEASKLP